ncbi:MAG: hypothetical protein A3J07_00855 [Candidatus Doudnabacteria bacterium RIFCSPLOWO2_02_FULL_49_13]|uniref:O-antigen ligase-related domain-containing protein n=1 Tax=Candidatus Doudnabacteria bacterium RIFCSPHIGHO2_12_FULL_48_16 TaxID=1817838 RepID=A0A1F5PK75_9BACT|nr:MAG: hypothetical protein A2760_04050 [Candidatus Doudnabacteria bacterium RIFCSPHIGHO2_01_FULL_50_67]OGE88893.1 MAG: hypothetical protein A3B77_03885 [Candidatus Doudnabacteria bacterium RIFCSPHIGHO2_02_FULL_49_24]OGE90301.1 MAG: hypothetical protein A3E29_04365 [Candidatus Doudnabacteria bacterium RIFCSPHIGHO2_12_FULL_48_16]OGE96729.1 MAG: hypothetical protein A2990_00355 [Candidatus Doudnabacteria bacterium RIFCSPLOWO2_01_FULL_49_40]OGF02357.1 MAG: hypothetical protein A3J07_00855 [Candid
MTIIFVISVCFLYLAFKKPGWALAVLLFLLPAYQVRFTLLGLPTTLLEVLILAFLVGLLAQQPDFRPLRKLGRLNWIIGLFLLAASVAAYLSPEKLKALGELKAFFIEPVLVFYALVLLWEEKSNIRLALQGLFVSSGLISLFGVVQYFTLSGLPIRFWGTGIEPERITSVFDYPNALALFLAPLFGLFAILIYKKYRLFEREWLEILGLLLMAAALILTFSRGAWLAVAITLTLFLIKNHSGRAVLTIVTLVLLGSLGVGVAPIRQRLVSAVSDASSDARLELMRLGIQKIQDEPFLGNGLHGFRTTLSAADFQGEILNYPHNIFLNFWLETGLLGLLAFGLIIGAVGERQKKHPTVWGLAAAAFLLIVILHGLVDVPYFKNDLAVLFWFAISLFYLDN